MLIPDTLTLSSGDILEWGSTPQQLRKLCDKAQLRKLVRNCENARIYSFPFGHAFSVHKGAFLTILDTMRDTLPFACTFDGLDLVMYGPRLDEEATGEEGEDDLTESDWSDEEVVGSYTDSDGDVQTYRDVKPAGPDNG